MVENGIMTLFKGEVRVNCSTYNHAPFIEETLNGFTMQVTNFPFTCCIVDDASKDGTQVILKKYLQNNFDLNDKTIVRKESTDDYVMTFARHKSNLNCYFVVYLLKYNHYSIKKPKVPFITEWSNTKYIASCEGDDYWQDPHKLQKQVDFMENNLDYGMVTTASKIYVQGIGMKDGVSGHAYRGLEDLLAGNYIFNATVLKRKSLEDSYKKEIGPHPEWKMGDWPKILHCAIVSKIGYIDEPTAVYRVLPNSASHFDSFDKFKAFNENSVIVAKFFINKYNLNAKVLFPLLDNWLKQRLLMRACSIGDIELVNKYKTGVTGLSIKEKINVFLSSYTFTNFLYVYYKKVRISILYMFH